MVYLYRINGGQVLSQSLTDVWTGTLDAFHAVLVDPSTPDGASLNPPKIRVAASIRNATAPEIANFVTAAATDENLKARTSAEVLYDTNLVFRKILKAIVQLTVDEINEVRTDPTTVKAARTYAQARTAILGKITAGSVD